jgi:hypothetical protein
MSPIFHRPINDKLRPCRDMQKIQTGPELVGAAIVVFGVLSALLYMLVRGLRSDSRSRRLATVGLFCGLAAFSEPELLLGSGSWGAWLVVAAVIRIVIVAVGISCAFLALHTRSGGETRKRPIAAIGFNILHFVLALGLLTFATITRPAEPWIYRSPDGAFRLTLPSKTWRVIPTGDRPGVAFGSKSPRMQALVSVKPEAKSEADFLREVARYTSVAEKNPRWREETKVHDGVNAGGLRYFFARSVEAHPGGQPIVVGYSVTWLRMRDSVVTVMFEGVQAMISQIGTHQEMEAIENAADTICSSVE